MSGESVCGDACAIDLRPGAATLMLADGLGHGELAAVASRQAVRSFAGRAADERPAQTLERLDAALRPTRGAAVTIAQLDVAASTVTFAGFGNVAAFVVDDAGERRAFGSTPGIVGNNAKRAREVVMPLPRNALVVLQSDGSTSKWDLQRYPGLRSRDPRLVAATLMRDAAVRHDDASVLVARAS